MIDSSKLKDFADDNFKFDENSRKLSKPVENTLGKGEIARYEQFLLFPQCFQKTYTADTQKPGLVWERIKTTRFLVMLLILSSEQNSNRGGDLMFIVFYG